MEWKEGSKDTEADEDEREEHVLYLGVDVVHGGNLVDVHRCGTTEIVDAENTDNKQGGSSHKHKGELHGRIFLLAATPHTDQEVHRDEGNLVEHKHGEHVGADEEAIDTGREKGEPKEILLGHRLQLP